MAHAPIVLNGQKVGRLRASFILLKETLRFFWADKEMIWIPIIAAIMQFLLIGLVVLFVIIPSGILMDEGTGQALSVVEYLTVFILYVIGAFTVASTQAAITHIVYTRAHGGNATLGDGLSVAMSHAGPLFIWACITSTVGVILRAIAERSQIMVKILTAIIGAAWSVLTYFVVPAIVIDKKGAIDSIRHSGSTFKRTWGETLVTNITLGLAVTVIFIGLIAVLVGIVVVFNASMVVVLFASIVFVIALVIMVLMSSVLDSVLRTLLYVYANEGTMPQNFNRELLEGMLTRKGGVTPSIPANTVV